MVDSLLSPLITAFSENFPRRSGDGVRVRVTQGLKSSVFFKPFRRILAEISTKPYPSVDRQGGLPLIYSRGG